MSLPTNFFIGRGGLASIAPGEAVFTSIGTHSWTCPSKVDSICIAGIGGGSSGPYGGAGGGLGYKNDLSVTPGVSYTVVVGAGASGTSSYPGNAGGDSYITIGGTNYGATGGGGSYVAGTPLNADGGGNGGGQPGFSNGAGGGAGGWTGSGGGGADERTEYFGPANGRPGSGGGGGGGADEAGYHGGAGGGSSILGGNGGTGGDSGQYAGGPGGIGPYPSEAAGSSGGHAGGSGGAYGGGGSGGSAGAQGAFRIIWGSERAFPSTNASQSFANNNISNY